MGVKRIKQHKDLPFEEGKTYTTKFQTGERFLLNKIIWKEIKIEGEMIKRMILFEGIYENSPDLGQCRLNIDRLIPERVESGEIDVCDYCNTPI